MEAGDSGTQGDARQGGRRDDRGRPRRNWLEDVNKGVGERAGCELREDGRG